MSNPPPVPARNKGGFFHSVKTTFSNSNAKTVDSDFEEKRREFKAYNDLLLQINSEVLALVDSYGNFSTSTLNIWDTFVRGYVSNTAHSGYITSNTARTCAASFKEITLPTSISILHNVRDTLKTTLSECSDLSSQVKQRDKNLEEFDYYMDKYRDLLDEREKTLSKGKPVKPADEQKIARNLEKKEHAEREYLDSNAIVSARLQRILDDRHNYLEPLLRLVLQAQTNLATGVVYLGENKSNPGSGQISSIPSPERSSVLGELSNEHFSPGVVEPDPLRTSSTQISRSSSAHSYPPAYYEASAPPADESIPDYTRPPVMKPRVT